MVVAPHRDALEGWQRQGPDEHDSGYVLVDLRRSDGARVVMQVSPPTGAPSLARAPQGDVSYRTCTGVTAAEAVALVRAFAERLSSGAMRLDRAPPSASRPASTHTSTDLAAHTFALQASGFTVLPSLVERDQLGALADIADRALAETNRQLELGATIPEGVFDRAFQVGARGLYLWGDACLRVLESDAMRELSQAVIGRHKLIDVVLFVSHPSAGDDEAGSEGWHRDVEPVTEGPYHTRYLWFMLPIDDFVADNGSTWVVPGSHRLAVPEIPAPASGMHRYPSRVQMLLDAGDALVLDPATLHSRGHNTTDRSRRMLNFMVCHEETPLIWQWDFVGRSVRAKATPRVRELLGGALSAEERAAFAAKATPLTHLQRGHAIRTPAWPALPSDWEE